MCLPKTGLSEPPSPSKDDRCKVTDVKNVGNKMSWKMKCTGPEPMTGEGEVTHGKDGFDGAMTMHSSQGDMKVKATCSRCGPTTSSSDASAACRA